MPFKGPSFRIFQPSANGAISPFSNLTNPLPRFQRTILFLTLFWVGTVAGIAQVTPTASENIPTGSIGGRVTMSGKPVARARVIVTTGTAFMGKSVGKATTDATGVFRVGNLPTGSYRLLVVAGALVNENNGETYNGKVITLGPGEQIEDLEIGLRSGGVITGRVTDGENRPVVGQKVSLLRLEKNPTTGEELPVPFSFGPNTIAGKFQTDDRGIYRLYGLPPGRYLVGVGQLPTSNLITIATGGQGYDKPAFHPKGSDWKTATAIDLAAGVVEGERDIVVGAKEDLFTIAGKLVDDQTDAPVPNFSVGLTAKTPGGGTATVNIQSDRQGEFRISQIKPGDYQIDASALSQENDFYNEPFPVKVKNEDLRDLVVRLKRGVTVSGTVLPPNGASSGSIDFSKYDLNLQPIQSNGLPGRGAVLGPDGSFRVKGLGPGTYRFLLIRFSEGRARRDLFVSGVQRNGVLVSQTEIEIGSESIGDLRLQTRNGGGKLRGEIRFVGGQRERGVQYTVSATSSDPAFPGIGSAEVDDRGMFFIDGLLPGPYQLRIFIREPGNVKPVRSFTPTNATIPESGETTIVVTIDLSPANQPNQP